MLTTTHVILDCHGDVADWRTSVEEATAKARWERMVNGAIYTVHEIGPALDLSTPLERAEAKLAEARALLERVNGPDPWTRLGWNRLREDSEKWLAENPEATDG